MTDTTPTAAQQAQALATATGSSSATHRVERRNADGSLTTLAEATSTGSRYVPSAPDFTTAPHLGQWDREVLSRASATGWDSRDKPVAFIVWRDDLDDLCLGRVRCRRAAHGRGEDRYEASPFPGAWVPVPVSRILLVRHADTL